MNKTENIIKLFAGLGDGAIGKTCLLIRFTSNNFPTDYVPTVFENDTVDVKYGDQVFRLGLWDFAGRGDSDGLMRLYLGENGNDVVFLTFSVVNSISFENVKAKYFPLVKQHCPNAKLLLVGTKCDLREDKETIAKLESKNMTMIAKSEAQKMAKEIGAEGYYETSALTGAGVKEVFEAAVASVIDKNSKKSSKGKACLLL